jgi:hypothetical protein
VQSITSTAEEPITQTSDSPTSPVPSGNDEALIEAFNQPPRRRRRKKHQLGLARIGRMQKPEDLYHHAIKAGLVRITRRRGAPPLIEWLKTGE